VEIKTFRGSWIIDGNFSFYDANWDAIATGTDPLDAWRKLRAERGHDPD